MNVPPDFDDGGWVRIQTPPGADTRAEDHWLRLDCVHRIAVVRWRRDTGPDDIDHWRVMAGSIGLDQWCVAWTTDDVTASQYQLAVMTAVNHASNGRNTR